VIVIKFVVNALAAITVMETGALLHCTSSYL